MADKRKRDNKKDKPFRRQRRKVCLLCSENKTDIDYKDVALVKKFVSDKGKILPRRVTGACAKHQRKISLAVARARHIALLPYTVQ